MGIAMDAVACDLALPAASGEQALLVKYLYGLNAAQDLPAIAAATATFAGQLAKAAGAVLLLRGDADGELLVVATYGSHATTCGLPRRVVHPQLERLLFEARRVNLPTADGPVGVLSPLRELCVGRRSRAIVLPICEADELLGAILLEFSAHGQTERATHPLLAICLRQAAVAIRRVRAAVGLCFPVSDLSAVAALHEALTRAPSFEQMLEEIIDRVKDMIGAERSGVMLYDPEADELVMQKPALGASEQIISQTRLPLSGGGVGPKVFLSGKPHLSHDLSKDHDIIPRLLQQYGGRNQITAPLDVNGRRIGVLHVTDKRGGDFTENDLRLASLLASHLGVLIHNARLIENERRTIAKLQDLNRVIDSQREGLQRTLDIHDEFTRMVLDGEGITAIVATLSRLVANPVAVKDCFANLISQSTPSGSHVVPPAHDDPTAGALLARLERERHLVRLPAAPTLGFDQPRVVVPILVGHEALGLVDVMESGRVLDELDLVAVQQAATAIALQMMKEKAATEAQYKLRGDLVAELLDGRFGPDSLLFSRAAYLRIDLTVPRGVLVLDVDDFMGYANKGRTEEKILALKAKLADVVERACRRVAPEAVVTSKSDEVIVLAVVQTAGEIERRAELRRLGDCLRGEVHRWLPEITVSVGIGSGCDTLAAYALSYRQAHQALDVIKACRHADRTLAFGELGIFSVLFEPEHHSALLALVESTLGGLIVHDRCHGTTLTETLDQYLGHDCHLERTALALHIHVNTLRYRLQRVEEVTATDLHDGEARFNLQLALKIRRMLNPQ